MVEAAFLSSGGLVAPVTRSPKMAANALSPGFQRMVHRVRLIPLGCTDLEAFVDLLEIV